MWKKILFGLVGVAILGVSYQQYQQVNLYGMPRKIETYQRHYNQVLGSPMVQKRFYNPRVQIMRPSAKKIRVQGNREPVIRVKVPYRFSSNFPNAKDHMLKYSNNFGSHIRVQAGGTVWTANNYQTARINLKHRSTTGKISFDLPIQDGYPEKALRNYQVYFLDYQTARVIVYRIS